MWSGSDSNACFPRLTAARAVGSAVQTKGFGSAFVSAMTDEQLDAALDALREIFAAPAGEAANVIDGSAEPVALPAPEAVPGGYARAQAKAQVAFYGPPR